MVHLSTRKTPMAYLQSRSGNYWRSLAHTRPVTVPSLLPSSEAQGCRFCRANREELWMQSGSDGTESLRDFWKASCWSCIISRLACCRSASRSSAVCRLAKSRERESRGRGEGCFVRKEILWSNWMTKARWISSRWLHFEEEHYTSLDQRVSNRCSPMTGKSTGNIEYTWVTTSKKGGPYL